MKKITWQIEKLLCCDTTNKSKIMWLCDVEENGVRECIADWSEVDYCLDKENLNQQDILKSLFDNNINKQEIEDKVIDLLLQKSSNSNFKEVKIPTQEEYEQAQKEGRITQY
jgi:hypothetical protein